MMRAIWCYDGVRRQRTMRRSPRAARCDRARDEARRLLDRGPARPAAQVAAGKIRSFLDAPSFELWLQCIFLPNARAEAHTGALPPRSQMGLMAMRQYDYHSHDEVAQPLLKLLYDFDAIVEGRPKRYD